MGEQTDGGKRVGAHPEMRGCSQKFDLQNLGAIGAGTVEACGEVGLARVSHLYAGQIHGHVAGE